MSRDRISKKNSDIIRFSTTPSGEITLFDSVERVKYTIETNPSVDFTPDDPSAFSRPVDDAIRFSCKKLSFPTFPGTIVRNQDGEMIGQVNQSSDTSFPDGAYTVELSVSLKFYIQVDSGLEFSVENSQMTLEFPEEVDLRLGAQSKHERPAALITTTPEPADMMKAISLLGSSLKTISPERSFPTFRGHPPEIELGNSLSIPPSVNRPETGISIEIPPEYDYIFPVSSLAYYLGANITPGDTPCIVTSNDKSYPLNNPGGFEDQVAQTLKHVFFLDCVVRTEGLYKIPMKERDALEKRLDLPFKKLYNAPPSERIESFLDVPHSVVQDLLPQWKITASVSLSPDTVETLPYLVNDLSLIRTVGSESVSTVEHSQHSQGQGSLTRGASNRSVSELASETTFVDVPIDTSSLQDVWIGEGTPVGMSKPSVKGYKNRFNRDLSDDDISITVVCNDDQMNQELDIIEDIYGSRENLPYEIEFYENTSVIEFQRILSTSRDFLHYIGHIDDQGIRCKDGPMDTSSISEVGVDAFLLNGCQSYQQGVSLIESGAIGGVVTISDVINTGAIRIGSTVARFLNTGFPLREALSQSKPESIAGSEYLVIGDGGLTVTQAESGTPIMISLTEQERTEEYKVTIQAVPTTSGGMGGVICPHFESVSRFSLNSGDIGSYTVSQEELVNFLNLEQAPVKTNGRLYWSADLASKLESDPEFLYESSDFETT